ncbi:MAG: hypothetical protein U1F76_29980 [Candidatus Competibacteraceae bacterium]
MIMVNIRKQGGAAIMTIPANVLKMLNVEVIVGWARSALPILPKTLNLARMGPCPSYKTGLGGWRAHHTVSTHGHHSVDYRCFFLGRLRQHVRQEELALHLDTVRLNAVQYCC